MKHNFLSNHSGNNFSKNVFFVLRRIRINGNSALARAVQNALTAHTHTELSSFAHSLGWSGPSVRGSLSEYCSCSVSPRTGPRSWKHTRTRCGAPIRATHRQSGPRACPLCTAYCQEDFFPGLFCGCDGGGR